MSGKLRRKYYWCWTVPLSFFFAWVLFSQSVCAESEGFATETTAKSPDTPAVIMRLHDVRHCLLLKTLGLLAMRTSTNADFKPVYILVKSLCSPTIYAVKGFTQLRCAGYYRPHTDSALWGQNHDPKNFKNNWFVLNVRSCLWIIQHNLYFVFSAFTGPNNCFGEWTDCICMN